MATGKTRKFSRDEAEAALVYIQRELYGYSKMKICGSLRRMKSMVGDIDIVVCPKDSDNTQPLIDSIHEIATGDPISSGKKIVRIMVKEIQIDFYLCSERLFGAHVLFLTGSKGFNIKCRVLAKGLGCRLSQYGLINADGTERAIDEADILEALGLQQFMDPELR